MKDAQATNRGRKVPVYGLDAVRLLAAIMVVVFHLGFKAWAVKGSTLQSALGVYVPFPPGYDVTWCGWIGVQVFFVVSGAVIAYSTQGVGARDFAIRRIARLLPALLIAVVAALPIAVLVFSVPAAKALWLAFKTLAFAPWGPWIIGQFWTIPIELAFYAAVCALLATGRIQAGMRLLVWGLGLGSAAYWFLVAAGWETGGRLSEMLLFQHGIYFALGMICARLGGGTLGRRHAMLAVVMLAAAAVQVRVAARWEMAQRPDLAEQWPQPYAVLLVFCACIAMSFLLRQAIATRIGMSAGLLRLAGMSTYPLYLVHVHVGGAILMAVHPFGPGLALACAFAGSLLAAMIIAVWLEPPLHVAVRSGLERIGRRMPMVSGSH